MIVVFASIILDHVANVDRLPGVGETVICPSYALFPGGKGANQALAAARAGAPVTVAGAVGKDGAAEVALSLLREGGVDLSRVETVDLPTGAAFLGVDKGGQNQIIVCAGANLKARAASLAGYGWDASDMLLLQRETPEAACIALAKAARAAGAQVVLNAAPAGPIAPALLDQLTLLIVNEHEAAVTPRARLGGARPRSRRPPRRRRARRRLRGHAGRRRLRRLDEGPPPFGRRAGGGGGGHGRGRRRLRRRHGRSAPCRPALRGGVARGRGRRLARLHQAGRAAEPASGGGDRGAGGTDRIGGVFVRFLRGLAPPLPSPPAGRVRVGPTPHAPRPRPQPTLDPRAQPRQ